MIGTREDTAKPAESATIALPASAELLALLRDRDVPCMHCGYNLRNLTISGCPECGSRMDFTSLEFQDRTYNKRQRRLIVSAVSGLATSTVYALAVMVFGLSIPYLTQLIVPLALLVPVSLVACRMDQQIYLDRQRLRRARSVPSFGVVTTPLSWLGLWASGIVWIVGIVVILVSLLP